MPSWRWHGWGQSRSLVIQGRGYVGVEGLARPPRSNPLEIYDRQEQGNKQTNYRTNLLTLGLLMAVLSWLPFDPSACRPR